MGIARKDPAALAELGRKLREALEAGRSPALLKWAARLLPELAERPAELADVVAQTIPCLMAARGREAVPFYEDFLAHYDPDLRARRGVYYTPAPVVSFMVRSVDKLLQTRLRIAGGLASPIRVLDPACGTGAFLHGIVDFLGEAECRPQLEGCELLPAPCAVARLSLNARIPGCARIRLANALEVSEAAAPPMVVLGNPPYSGHSSNQHPFVRGLLRDYYWANGQPLWERNTKWLQDDYVKFLRWAQWTGAPIVAFVTNHGYLDNPTFRGMRESLLSTFDEIFVLDLHGNSKKRERALDQNVFSIRAGVAIGFFVRSGGARRVRFHELWGSREEKCDWLNSQDVETTPWEDLEPRSPLHLFRPRRAEREDDFARGIPIPELFERTIIGPNSHRDGFAVAFTYEEALARLEDLRDPALSDEALRAKYGIEDNRDWSLARARRHPALAEARPVCCLYRPFDYRYMLYGPFAFDYHRPEVNDPLLQPNLALLSTRQTKEDFAVFVTDVPVGQHKLVTPYDGSYVSPLYLAGRSALKAAWFDAEPRALFDYIYALLWSPAYRERYAEQLRQDFPRVLPPPDRECFETLAGLGRELVELHALRRAEPCSAGEPCSPSGKPNWGSAAEHGSALPEIWNFRVGGYQVCRKWHRDRRGRILSEADREHFARICSAILGTLRLLPELDLAVRPMLALEFREGASRS